MLTDADCRNATCPADKKRARLTDAGGLYLEVSPAGAKRWFWKFYPDGKESRLALGSYGKGVGLLTLKAARAARDEARKTHRAGTNPVQQRKADKLAAKASSATTFEAVAREFHGIKSAGWSAGHGSKWLRMNELYLFPEIGSLPVTSIKAPVLLAALRKVEAKGILSTAQDLKAMSGQVFGYAIERGLCERNPVSDFKRSLKTHTPKHFAAILDPAGVGAMLHAFDAYSGTPETVAALKLSALLFQRPGNVRAMQWADLDLDGAQWAVPAVAMKGTLAQKTNGRPHLVPLAQQAVAILRELHPLTGHGRYVFPSLLTGERPMSENTIRTALRRMGYGNDQMTAHGFRAVARTLMIERLPGIAADVIEAQLAHGKSGPLGAAYDRAEFMDQRRAMMQTWADYLDRLRSGAQVISLNAA